jgi:carbonic anhydrase/acetyltransferase-like protein (isoleucine patch superfamily)
MAIYQLGADIPLIPASAYVAAEATIIGRVRLGERASVWPGAVLRGDDDAIDIGDDTNIQDGAVLHVDPGLPMKIGRGVTIGHQAMLHGCTIGDGALIGIGAVIYNKAVIGNGCIVGIGAIVTEGKVFPDRSLIVGTPARLVRELSEQDIEGLKHNVDAYVARGDDYRARLKRIG